MLTHLRSNVVGYLALFVALGGTSYAAVQLPKNSVRSAQVKDGSLASKDLSAKARKSLKGQTGATGAAGAAGAAGAVGAKGDKGDKGDTASAPVIADGGVGTAKLAAVPFVEVSPSANLSIANTGFTLLALNDEDADAFGMHSPFTPSRITAPIAGLYLVTVRTNWIGAASGTRTIIVRDPLVTTERVIYLLNNGTVGNTMQTGSGVVRLSAGEQLEVVVGQDSSTDPLTLFDFATRVQVVWVSN